MQTKLFGIAIKWLLLAAVVIAILLYASSVMGLFSKRNAYNAKAAGVTAEGEASVAKDAGKATTDQVKSEAAGAASTAKQVDDIKSAKGASDAVPDDVNAAFRKSLCMHEPYRSKPACTPSK